MASEEGTSCVGNDSVLPGVGWVGVRRRVGQVGVYTNNPTFFY